MIRANPLLGVGLGAYDGIQSLYKERRIAASPACHNDYLQIIATAESLAG
jgi:O-antigen ligase